MKFLASVLLALTVSVGAFAQTSDSKSDKGVGTDLKNAGKSTASATKKTGRKIKKTTKKAVNKSADKTEQGAAAVENKTK